jgi:LmbE family N-acetylglucosaminyl deacetylase
MIKTAMTSARRFVREQRWGKVVASRLIRGCPDRPPELITRFDDGPVLVIAPHMDDETFGCGGTIIRHRQAGADVTILFMTDGARGNPAMVRDESLIDRRKDEVRRAMKLLGNPQVRHLDLPERELVCDEPTIELVKQQIRDIAPAVVYVPSIFDGHPDHIATCRIASAAMMSLADRGEDPIVREYEVWSTLTANALVDVSDVFEQKLEALRQFDSQLLDMDYVYIARGLSMYRSLFHLHGKGAAEAFFQCSVEGHADLVRQVRP